MGADGKIYADAHQHGGEQVGAATTLKPPGSRTVYAPDGEGSAGPLDLIANDGQGFWHQQVWPKLPLTGSRSGKNIVFRVTRCG